MDTLGEPVTFLLQDRLELGVHSACAHYSPNETKHSLL